jgi:hypothetical protein
MKEKTISAEEFVELRARIDGLVSKLPLPKNYGQPTD